MTAHPFASLCSLAVLLALAFAQPPADLSGLQCTDVTVGKVKGGSSAETTVLIPPIRMTYNIENPPEAACQREGVKVRACDVMAPVVEVSEDLSNTIVIRKRNFPRTCIVRINVYCLSRPSNVQSPVI